MDFNFGAGFGYVQEDPIEYLPEGDYNARITGVVNNEKLKGAVNVLFSIQGHPNASPYSMTLFARPVVGQTKKDGSQITNEDLQKWDKTMSRFFDAFGIKAGDFDFVHWKQHSGWVTCRKNKNNDYSSLYVAFNQHKEKTPESVQKVAAVFNGSSQKSQNTATPSDFPEDLNF